MTWSPFDRPLAGAFDLDALPPGWTPGDSGTCRSCGASIVWCTHGATGSKAPFDPDGRPHQPTCPHRDFWRERARARREGGR